MIQLGKQMKVLTRSVLLLLLCYAWQQDINGQALSFNLKKPAKYENRLLGSEKNVDKKFHFWRAFKQNGVTKFNWHFNAREKLQQVIERAKLSHRDDYTQLLPFYNFSLDKTAQDRDLDSVIYKANAGILIHDLRNSWIDNLYMLMGEAYYFKNQLDTAYMTFQYVNYAFSPKEKDGYDLPIGSNANEGGSAFSVSTKENTSLGHRIWTSPPSRNESFIWQIKTFLANNELPEAAGLIETLKHDPAFPERLHGDLREVQAWYFYKQEMYDSSAVYLEQALGNAANKGEQARWEYLIAQMYERVNQPEKASEFYNRTIQHTLDPVLEVYARLNAIRQNKGDEKVIQENLDALLKMARRDKYTNYRDIIYYMAAQIELERGNTDAAKALLLKSTQYTPPESDNSQKSRAFLQLAELSFQDKNYYDAKRFYDSITVPNLPGMDQSTLEKRRGVLSKIVEQQGIIKRQDSLQFIANMPEAEREALLRKMAKQLRKQQGLKEEETSGASNLNPLQSGKETAPADLFNNNAKGEWYFHNPSLKGKGYTEFKGKWGNRKNVDNWRRMAAVNQATNQVAVPSDQTATLDPESANAGNTSDISYEGLLKNIPLTPDLLAVSNDSIENASVLLGKTLIEGLEDYPAAITVLEGFLERYPYSNKRPEALFHLYYCYAKTGDSRKADAMARELKQKYEGSEFEKIVSNPKGSPAELAAKAEMTRKYESIYNLFIEGNFAEAQAQKKVADSLYGTNYWTPQLLYIQSVYQIRERMDDSAKNTLQNIIGMYPTSPLAGKAQTMLDVLGRRKEIEEYLTNLKIERPKEDSLVIVDDSPTKPVVVADTVATVAPPLTVEQQDKQLIDSIRNLAAQKVAGINKPPAGATEKQGVGKQPPAVVGKGVPGAVITRKDTVVVIQPAAPGKPAFTFDPNAPHHVVIVLNKVDHVYVTETRNAYNRFNKEKFYNKPIDVGNQVLNDTTKLVVMTNFENAAAALDYMEKAVKVAPTEVIPWLPKAKYSFIIISGPNLELLKSTQDMESYRKFLSQAFPGKF